MQPLTPQTLGRWCHPQNILTRMKTDEWLQLFWKCFAWGAAPPLATVTHWTLISAITPISPPSCLFSAADSGQISWSSNKLFALTYGSWRYCKKKVELLSLFHFEIKSWLEARPFSTATSKCFCFELNLQCSCFKGISSLHSYGAIFKSSSVNDQSESFQ